MSLYSYTPTHPHTTHTLTLTPSHTHTPSHPHTTHTLCRWQGSGEEEKGLDKSTSIVRVEVDPKFYRPTEVVSAIQQLPW